MNYTYTRQQSANYTLMIVGASQSNQDVEKLHYDCIPLWYKCNFTSFLCNKIRTKPNLSLQLNHEEAYQQGPQGGNKTVDNEYRDEYKRVIIKKWQSQYRLVPPNVHQRNVAEQAIRTFKAQLLSILAGVDPGFPKYMCATLLQQTELTLNLLHQSKINPKILVRDYFNGPFDYAANPLGPLGSRRMIYKTVNTRK